MANVNKEYDKIINLIKKRKEELGFTQVELAEEANICVANVSRILNIEHLPRVDTILLLLKILGVELTFKINGEEI